MHVLGHLTIEEFLRDYWQKKPVLIRNAWPNFEPLLAADELAGLSLEPDIESRLIIEDGLPHEQHSQPWQLKRGPFDEETFRALPEEKWTLLIQGVDHWIPAAADLLQHFNFIPTWRMDDLMISYAVNGGSVGAHYDQYDVFLLQAQGQREWSIGQMCDEHTPFLKGSQLRILEQFQPTDSWVLNPGDMLYLPPQLAHHGVAQGECMTYSIGFRAPSQLELAQATLDDILASASDDHRYQDTDLELQVEPGKITTHAAKRLRNCLASALNDESNCQRILGKLMTEAKYPEHQPDTLPDDNWPELEYRLRQYPMIRKAEFARFAYSQHSTGGEFFYQGQSQMITLKELNLISYLANHNRYLSEQLLSNCDTTVGQNLLITLWSQQLIYVEE